MMGPCGAMGWMTPIFPILFLVLILAALWAIFGRRNWGGPGWGAGETSPLEIAKKRYARGEITREEYEEIKRTLE